MSRNLRSVSPSARSSGSSSSGPSSSDYYRSGSANHTLAPSDEDDYSSEDGGHYSSRDKVAPWTKEASRPASSLNFRRSSAATTIVPVDLPMSKSGKSSKVKSPKSKAEAQAEDDRAALAYMQLHPEMDMLSMMVMARDPNAPPKPKKVKPASDAADGGKRRFFGLVKR